MLAALMDDAESAVLAQVSCPKEQRTKLHSTNPIERLKGEIKRRSEAAGNFTDDEVIVRLGVASVRVSLIIFSFRRSRIGFLTAEAESDRVPKTRSRQPILPAVAAGPSG